MFNGLGKNDYNEVYLCIYFFLSSLRTNIFSFRELHENDGLESDFKKQKLNNFSACKVQCVKNQLLYASSST